VVANVMLVKAAHEVTAPAAGIIESIEVAAEQNFARGKALARLKTG
jgi:biotin carboxyl carrier protein